MSSIPKDIRKKLLDSISKFSNDANGLLNLCEPVDDGISECDYNKDFLSEPIVDKIICNDIPEIPDINSLVSSTTPLIDYVPYDDTCTDECVNKLTEYSDKLKLKFESDNKLYLDNYNKILVDLLFSIEAYLYYANLYLIFKQTNTKHEEFDVSLNLMYDTDSSYSLIYKKIIDILDLSKYKVSSDWGKYVNSIEINQDILFTKRLDTLYSLFGTRSARIFKRGLYSELSPSQDISGIYTRILSVESMDYGERFGSYDKFCEYKVQSIVNILSDIDFIYTDKLLESVAFTILDSGKSVISQLKKQKVRFIDSFNEYTNVLKLVDHSLIEKSVVGDLESVICCGKNLNVESDSQEDYTDDLSNNAWQGSGNPNMDKIDYWRRYAKMLSMQNLIPLYWTVGLIIPTPSGPKRVKLPTVWRAIAVITISNKIIVFFLTINGIIVFPVIYVYNMKGFPIPSVDLKLLVQTFKNGIREKLKSLIGDVSIRDLKETIIGISKSELELLKSKLPYSDQLLDSDGVPSVDDIIESIKKELSATAKDIAKQFGDFNLDKLISYLTGDITKFGMLDDLYNEIILDALNPYGVDNIKVLVGDVKNVKSNFKNFKKGLLNGIKDDVIASLSEMADIDIKSLLGIEGIEQLIETMSGYDIPDNVSMEDIKQSIKSYRLKDDLPEIMNYVNDGKDMIKQLADIPEIDAIVDSVGDIKQSFKTLKSLSKSISKDTIKDTIKQLVNIDGLKDMAQFYTSIPDIKLPDIKISYDGADFEHPSGKSTLLTLFRGSNQLIKDKSGNKALNIKIDNFKDVLPEISLKSPYIQDDLPIYERLSIKNVPYVLFLDKWLSKAKPYMGFK